MPELSANLVVPNDVPTLELDELWSFVLKKANKRWIWIALCRQTRQVVAFVIGDRSEATCQRLWEKIPQAFRQAHCFSDFWEAYQLVGSAGATYSRRKRLWRNGSRRKMEQYASPAARPLCPQNIIVFKERCDARNMFVFILASL